MKKQLQQQNEKLLGQLEELAENLGIEVRFEKLKKESTFFPGGLCKVKGEDIIIINSSTPIEDKIEILGRALSPLDLSQIYVLPALRELLDSLS
ncbi:hypothetical protein ACFL1N_09025 [Thermodesulfobacteriota bacterium]